VPRKRSSGLPRPRGTRPLRMAGYHHGLRTHGGRSLAVRRFARARYEGPTRRVCNSCRWGGVAWEQGRYCAAVARRALTAQAAPSVDPGMRGVGGNRTGASILRRCLLPNGPRFHGLRGTSSTHLAGCEVAVRCKAGVTSHHDGALVGCGAAVPHRSRWRTTFEQALSPPCATGSTARAKTLARLGDATRKAITRRDTSVVAGQGRAGLRAGAAATARHGRAGDDR